MMVKEHKRRQVGPAFVGPPNGVLFPRKWAAIYYETTARKLQS